MKRKALAWIACAAMLAACQAMLPLSTRPDPARLDRAQVERGARLAAIGACRGCHTRLGGEAFAGGEPLHSPFGTIYSTNITPDEETGIGRWTLAAFQRAMREGLRVDGAHLYPAFPYDRFTRVTDEDNAALYAYLMSLPPVRYRPPANELVFPFNVRAGIALWKRLYFHEGPRPASSSDAVLARGEYLVEGLGHCGSCHSPRNRLFAEDLAHVYDGGEAQGWHAYAINRRNAAPIAWDVESLTRYLRRGYDPEHGISRGTMGVVTEELAYADEADVRAMAAYVAKLMGAPDDATRERARGLLRDPLVARSAASDDEGARIYRLACIECHDARRELPFGGLPLAWSIGVRGESPRNLVNVIVHGIPPAEGTTTPMMPGYAGVLSDREIETLVHWLRANLTDQPAWRDVGNRITEAKKMDAAMRLYPPGGAGKAP